MSALAIHRIAQQRNPGAALGVAVIKTARGLRIVWPAALGPEPTAEEIADEERRAAVPQILTPAQLRLQLAADGKSVANVSAIIASLPEPMQTQAGILFEYSIEFRRAHPLVIQLAAALGYDTGAKLDAFFIAAAKL